jgi:hypothetical protein
LGATLNIASKLQNLASPGEVVISEATAKLLPPSIHLRPLQIGPDTPDIGFLRAFTITDISQDYKQRRPVSKGPFVGRHSLLQRVLSRLGATRDEPIGLLLSGEPGMGKSRFVQEVIAHAGTSIAWIEIA